MSGARRATGDSDRWLPRPPDEIEELALPVRRASADIDKKIRPRSQRHGNCEQVSVVVVGQRIAGDELVQRLRPSSDSRRRRS